MAGRADTTAPELAVTRSLYRLLLDDEELKAGVRTLLEGDHRLAQEQVGVELLASLCPPEP